MEIRTLSSLLALALAFGLTAGAMAETKSEIGLFSETAQAPGTAAVQLPRSLEEISGTPSAAVPADPVKAKATGIPEPGTIAIGLAILGASCAGRVRQCWRETKPVVSSK